MYVYTKCENGLKADPRNGKVLKADVYVYDVCVYPLRYLNNKSISIIMDLIKKTKTKK